MPISYAPTSWNPVVGCEPVSEGCKNCWAMKLHNERHEAYWRNLGSLPEQYAEPFSKVQLLPDRLEQPLRWRKPRTVAVCFMGDLFHEQVPDEFIDQMFGVMALAPQHTFLVLTKRPDRMQGYMKRLVSGHCSLVNAAAPFRTFGDNRQALDIIERANAALPNVWLGVTAENQHWADVRIPLLLDTPGKHWVSLEPLLGAIEFPLPCKESRFWGGISWLVVGGESGPGHRRMELAWADSISEQCYAAGVPYYGKQIAGNQPGQPLPGALGRKELPWTR